LFGPYSALTAGEGHVNPRYPKPEIKYNDFDADGGFSAAAVVSIPAPLAGRTPESMNTILQGTSQSQRIGYSVNTKSCAYRFTVKLGPTPVQCNGRFVLVWDKSPNGGVSATYSSIFAQDNYLAMQNPYTKDRYVILRNTAFSLSPNGDETLYFEGYVKINMITTYQSDGASEAFTGMLLSTCVSDQALVPNQPLIAGTWRVKFTDC